MIEIPYFSVVMCANRIDDYFWLSVKSILNQTYSNFEFIIVLNGESGLKSDFVSYGIEDKRIFLHQTCIQQLAFNLNYGINFSRGTYVVRMDADDISLPSRLERLYFICKKKSPDVVGSWAKIINEYGCNVCSIRPPCDNDSIRKSLSYGNCIVHPSVAIHRKTLLSFSGYIGDLYAEDYDFWLRIKRDKNIVFMTIPEYLLEYRVHTNNSVISRKKILFQYAASSSFIYREFLLFPRINLLFPLIKSFFIFYISGVLNIKRKKSSRKNDFKER